MKASEAAKRLRDLYSARKADIGAVGEDDKTLASVDPLIQMCRLADVRPDAKTESDFYPEADEPPFLLAAVQNPRTQCPAESTLGPGCRCGRGSGRLAQS